MILGLSVTVVIFFIILFVLMLSGLKVVNEYERGVRFTLGKHSGTIKPGLRVVWPFIQSWQRVDMRTTVIDVPDQDAITKDNVTVHVNAVLYYQVLDASTAILEVESFKWAVSQMAQTTLRDVVGEATLDQLLSQRDAISKRVQTLVDKGTDPWGVKIESVELKHIELPEDMKRVMAKQAESEREKRAVIILAEGEVTAATNMAKAAEELSKIPGALHLRTLHSINDLSSDKSRTTVYAVPIEVLRMLERLGK